MSAQPAQSPKVVLEEGLNRARHIAVAVVMILYLLARLLVVKIIWARVRMMAVWAGFHLARVFLHIYTWLLPHWERLKRLALETTHRWLRVVLCVLFEALLPLEKALARVGVVLKAHTERVAVRGAMTLAELLRSIFGAIGALFSAGFSRPAAKKFMLRLSELLEEAQR